MPAVPCAGIPALSQHLLLHVDPQTWTTALSPDGLALVVFLRGKDRSLSSLLSEPVRPDMSLANRQLVAHRHHAHTRVNAITFAGELHPSQLQCAGSQ